AGRASSIAQVQCAIEGQTIENTQAAVVLPAQVQVAVDRHATQDSARTCPHQERAVVFSDGAILDGAAQEAPRTAGSVEVQRATGEVQGGAQADGATAAVDGAQTGQRGAAIQLQRASADSDAPLIGEGVAAIAANAESATGGIDANGALV